jgi:hypothetical protein
MLQPSQNRLSKFGVVLILVISVFPLLASAQQIETILYSFQGGNDGSNPAAGLIADKAGSLYGTTRNGGSTACNTGGCGTVFELSPPAAPGGQWTETVLYVSLAARMGPTPFPA